MTEIYEVKYIKFVQASMHHYDCFKVLKLALVASSSILASLMSSPYIIMLSIDYPSCPARHIIPWCHDGLPVPAETRLQGLGSCQKTWEIGHGDISNSGISEKWCCSGSRHCLSCSVSTVYIAKSSYSASAHTRTRSDADESVGQLETKDVDGNLGQ
jgi:hypothetical protein